MPEYWIQIENRPWDVSPNNIDRMTGESIKDRETPHRDPVDVQLVSPTEVPPVTTTVTMFRPLRDSSGNVTDALILRRYRPPQQPDQSDAWTAPDDRKINPWDLNEPDPTDNGTMGTIPGPVIECTINETVTVHFRNMDQRVLTPAQTITIPVPFGPPITITIPAVLLPIERRTHSLHPHGFVFAPTSDGAYPLSPPDPTQPIPAAEAAAWASVPGFKGNLKKGDRVPPGGTYTYTWNTLSWPTTAGVWLYHDHSICDMDNVSLGAIGIIVIHNTSDPEDIVTQDLPGGSLIGSPISTRCFPIPIPIGVLPHQLENLGVAALVKPPEMVGMGAGKEPPEEEPGAPAEESGQPTMEDASAPALERSIQRADFTFELNEQFNQVRRLCFSVYRTPPSQAVYLQLFHSLGDVGTCINGRTYLGNTPTMVAGPGTKMRFGVVGMGSEFHTFHLHGHRWTILGPHGNNPGTIQNSIEDTPVSQFEDTRPFGPANSFAFFIDEGNGFFRAQPAPIGEWHMHCHVLMHMDTGMMGSLLIVNGGEAAFPRFGHDDSSLPVGVPCMAMVMGGGGGGAPMTATVRSTDSCEWKDDASGTPETTIKVGGTVSWIYGGCGPNHSVISDNVAPFDTLAPPLNLSGATAVNPGGLPQSRVFSAVGNYGYHCGVHGGDPVSKTPMWGIVHVVP